MKQRPVLPEIPPEEQTPAVKMLLALVEQLIERVQQQDEEIALLKDEINILKGEKKRPAFKGSKLDQRTQKKNDDDDSRPSSGKRPGSRKRKKTRKLHIHDEKVIEPAEPIPPGSRFKGYRDFVVQDLRIESHNTRYRLAHWVSPQGQSMTGQLPPEVNNAHFGPQLIAYILYQYHHCHVTQPLLREQLHEWGVDMSAGQINQILLQGKEDFHAEKDSLLQSGLATSAYVTVDDSGARHRGKNGFVTQIGNALFAWFQSTESKSRINFLNLLRAGKSDYRLNEAALAYMQQQKLPAAPLRILRRLTGKQIPDEDAWWQLLQNLAITHPRHQRIATEGALLGSVRHHGLCDDLVIVSDDAGQFNILLHALCWVHSERLIHKMLPLNDTHRQEIAQVRGEVWDFYAQLKQYKEQPTPVQRDQLDNQFGQIFSRKTSYATLNQTLKRIFNNKDELLRVLDRPEIPLHTNGSETDLRDFVKKRKISGGTRSNEGRRCRDTFASLKKTCRKLDISFWDYLTDRLGIGRQSVPWLPKIISERAGLATDY